MDAPQQDPWDTLRAAQVAGWYVGIPLYDLERHQWQLYAFDTTQPFREGYSRHERKVIGTSEHECVSEMARCLRDIGAGRVQR